MTVEISRDTVTGIVLCGGRGSRLNGEDKPLLNLDEARIIDHMCKRLKPQVKEIIISCSRNVAIYEALHFTIAIDRELNRGPLAGLCEAFKHVETEWTITTPGDTPFLSSTLVSDLGSSGMAQGIAVPIVNGVRQNLNLLLNLKRRQQLKEFHEAGGLAVKHWLDQEHIESVDFSESADDFYNINTQVDLETARNMLVTKGA